MAGCKFMSEMYLRQPGFTYSACGPFDSKYDGLKYRPGSVAYIVFTQLFMNTNN